MINFFSGQDAIYFDIETNHLTVTYAFTLLVISLKETSCITNNGNILTDRSNERKYLQRRFDM